MRGAQQVLRPGAERGVRSPRWALLRLRDLGLGRQRRALRVRLAHARLRLYAHSRVSSRNSDPPYPFSLS